MKLNNHGWSFQEMIIIMSILVICLLVVVFYVYRLGSQIDIQVGDDPKIIEKNNSDINDYYVSLENNLEKSAINYIENYYNGELTSSFIITLNDLKDVGIIDLIKGYEDIYECNGYVKVAKYNDEYDYMPFLRCQNYKTKNYNSIYE